MPVVDGRTARAERTRTSIVDALLMLIEEGDLRPSAARVAERAGISDRLIYHHFDDMEALLQSAAERQEERIRQRSRPVDPAQPRARRIDAVVADRGRVFEWLTPFRRAALLHEPFSPALRAHRRDVLARNRQQLARTFAPELDGLAPATRRELLAALDASLSWETWYQLREAGHSERTVRGVVARMVASLLDAADAEGRA